LPRRVATGAKTDCAAASRTLALSDLFGAMEKRSNTSPTAIPVITVSIRIKAFADTFRTPHLRDARAGAVRTCPLQYKDRLHNFIGEPDPVGSGIDGNPVEMLRPRNGDRRF
jgi:hypothetical protein